MSISKYSPQLAILAVLIVSRLLVSALGLHPDPAIVVDHWQHIDLRFLASDPFGSLWALHTQPPLWNGILALAVAMVGPDGEAVTNLMFGFHLLLTAGGALMLFSLLRHIGMPVLAATIFTSLAICSPNILYFENYIFYPHFTAFLVTLLLWLLVRVRRDGPLWPVAASLGVLTALSLTWAIFHPAFVVLAGATLIAWRHGLSLKSFSLRPATRPTIAIAIAAIVIASLPTIKNAITYGIPSASTWIGMNLAQTIPGGQSGEFVHCDFDTAQREGVAAHPGLPTDHPLLTQAWKNPNAANFNHAGMIATSQRCMDMTKAVILHDPIGWLSFRIETLIGTHQLAPSNYNADPLGWNAIFAPMESAVEATGSFARSLTILWYLVLIYAGVKAIRSNPPLYLSLLGLIAYFTFASHFLNGGEQARMRYTIEPIYLVFSAQLLLAAWRRFGANPGLGKLLGRASAPGLTPS